MSREGKSPEDWEASDHIDALKAQLRRLAKPEDLDDVCPQHVGLFNAILPAQIWQIRHMDRQEKRNGGNAFNVRLPFLRACGSPLAVICVLLVVAVLLLALRDTPIVGRLLGTAPAAADPATSVETPPNVTDMKRAVEDAVRDGGDDG
jgi:hypothetical protein